MPLRLTEKQYAALLARQVVRPQAAQPVQRHTIKKTSFSMGKLLMKIVIAVILVFVVVIKASAGTIAPTRTCNDGFDIFGAYAPEMCREHGGERAAEPSNAVTEDVPAAPEDRQSVVAVFDGTCTATSQVLSNCDSKATFIVIGNGRSFVGFISDQLVFSFNGGHDRQPDLNHYYLSIDSVRMMNGTTKVFEDLSVEGECAMTVSDDGNKFYTVHCTAHNQQKEEYSFRLDNISTTQISFEKEGIQ